jgi:hypothetical protein
MKGYWITSVLYNKNNNSGDSGSGSSGGGDGDGSSSSGSRLVTTTVPYFSIDNVHPKLFRHSSWCIDNTHDTN